MIDAYARRIVGWKVSTSATASFVLDALEQAIHVRRPGPEDGLIHHSDRGVQGGFNRSSQHFKTELYDGYQETTFGSVHTVTAAIAGKASGCQSASACHVLGVCCCRDEQRGSSGEGWSVTTSWQPLVSGGGRYATSGVQAFGGALVEQIFVNGGTRRDRVASGPGAWRARDLAPPQSSGLDDFTRDPTQRGDA